MLPPNSSTSSEVANITPAQLIHSIRQVIASDDFKDGNMQQVLEDTASTFAKLDPKQTYRIRLQKQRATHAGHAYHKLHITLEQKTGSGNFMSLRSRSGAAVCEEKHKLAYDNAWIDEGYCINDQLVPQDRPSQRAVARMLIGVLFGFSAQDTARPTTLVVPSPEEQATANLVRTSLAAYNHNLRLSVNSNPGGITDRNESPKKPKSKQPSDARDRVIAERLARTHPQARQLGAEAMTSKGEDAEGAAERELQTILDDSKTPIPEKFFKTVLAPFRIKNPQVPGKIFNIINHYATEIQYDRPPPKGYRKFLFKESLGGYLIYADSQTAAPFIEKNLRDHIKQKD